MKSISLWAYRHPKTSWMLIIVIHIMLNFLSGYLGILGILEQVVIPDCINYILPGIFLIILLMAPIRRSRYHLWKSNFLKEKIYIGLMTITGMAFSYLWNYQLAADVSHSEAEIVMVVKTALYSHAPDNKIQHSPMINIIKDNGIMGGISHIYKSIVLKMKNEVDTKDLSSDNSINKKKRTIIWLMVALSFALLVLACAVGCSSMNTALNATLFFGAIIIPIVIGILWTRKITLKRSSTYQPRRQ